LKEHISKIHHLIKEQLKMCSGWNNILAKMPEQSIFFQNASSLDLRKLEAQWVEPVLLNCHFASRKIPTNFQLIWPNGFREDFFNWPITSKNCLWWPYYCMICMKYENFVQDLPYTIPTK
jgi:hypothetical protein